MTNCTSKLQIQSISLTAQQLLNIKQQLASRVWGVLLESADIQSADSRWSIYSAEPIRTLVTKKGITEVNSAQYHDKLTQDPFLIIENQRKQLFHDICNPLDLPFTGGALGSFGYELGYQLENVISSKQASSEQQTEMALGFYNWALVEDNKRKKLFLVTHQTKQCQHSANELWHKRQAWLLSLAEIPFDNTAFQLQSQWQANMDKSAYAKKFATC